VTVKKGRHRRFEEARALKRSQEVDYDDLFDSLSPEDEPAKPEHDAWADLAEESDDEPSTAVAAEHDEEEADDVADSEAESA